MMIHIDILRHMIFFFSDVRSEIMTQFKSFKTARPMLVLRRPLLLVLCGLLCVGVTSDAFGANKEKVNQLKAAFIYNFIKYVQWPEDVDGDVIHVGILGDDPLAKPLREIAKKRKVKGKRLEVQIFSDGQPFHPCEIIFVSANRVDDLDTFREELEASHVLLIGDTKGLVEKGVAINFVLLKDRLRFEVSQKALKRAKLVIGAQMLKLAILVDKKENK
jgi:hypothetical protein